MELLMNFDHNAHNKPTNQETEKQVADWNESFYMPHAMCVLYCVCITNTVHNAMRMQVKILLSKSFF